jgi:hypothetical protein
MKLVPFSPQYLRLNEPLPFGLRDDSGRLLLAAGQAVQTETTLQELMAKALFSEEHESASWHRRLAGALDQALRQGVTLQEVAAVRPDAPAKRTVAPVELSLTEQWHEMIMHLDAALRDVRPDSDWQARLQQVHERARELVGRRADASLYHLVFEAGHGALKYSSSHAMLCMVICEQAAPLLGWPQDHIDSLGRAALTMNTAMVRLQDELAASELPPTSIMREVIANHAVEGARLLRAAGMSDALCLAVIPWHHDGQDADHPLNELSPERQLARLLMRVDIFCAKISRRATRRPMSPVQAARESCLGCKGVPDEIGGALLRAVGLYPPGSFVELVSGELGIVVARGRRANLPYVASLVSAGGHPLGEPALRDTIERRHAVRCSVASDQVKVRPPHERLLAMR